MYVSVDCEYVRAPWHGWSVEVKENITCLELVVSHLWVLGTQPLQRQHVFNHRAISLA